MASLEGVRGEFAPNFNKQEFNTAFKQNPRDYHQLLRCYIMQGSSKPGNAKGIDFCIKTLKQLDQKDPIYGLTPFAVAVMKGDIATATKLKDKGVDFKTQDHQGWTPLHYATARNDQPMIAFLKSHEVGLEKIKNIRGETPADLENRFSVVPAQDHEIVFKYKDEAGAVVEGTALKFKEMTGARFVAQSLLTFEGLHREWTGQDDILQTDPISDRIHNIIAKKYESFTPKKVYISESKVGLGVFAEEEIPEGALIVRYSGEKIGDTPEDLRYFVAPDMNGLDYRDFGPMLNDSFPNAELQHIIIDGKRREIVAVALRNIHSGEEIFVNYGDTADFLKGKQHQELNSKEAEKWAQDPTLFKPLNIGEDSRENLLMAQFNAVARRKYLLSTPTTTLKLLLENTLRLEDYEKMLNSNGTKDLLTEKFWIANDQILKFLKGYYLPLKENEPAKANEVTVVLYKLLDNFDLNVMILFFQGVEEEESLNNFLDRLIVTQTSFDAIMDAKTLDYEELSKFLKSAQMLPDFIHKGWIQQGLPAIKERFGSDPVFAQAL